MRIAPLASAAALIASSAFGQTIPTDPIMDGAMPPAEMQQAPAPQAAPLLREFDTVEVADAENPGLWNDCTVIEVFNGAYEVSCNYTRTIERDIHVRKPGGQTAGQTAAQPVSGPPFKAGDIVLGTTMGLPDDWRLCVILRNQVQSSNSYVANCGGGTLLHLLPTWVRVDPDAPQ